MRTAGRSSSPEPSQLWQAYLGRMVRITRSWGGMTSSFSLVSSPMRTNSAPHRQCFCSSGMSITHLITGKSFGKGPPLGPHARVLGDANQPLGDSQPDQPAARRTPLHRRASAAACPFH